MSIIPCTLRDRLEGRSAHRRQEAAGRRVGPRPQGPAARPVVAEDPGLQGGRRGDVPRPRLAGEELDHEGRQARRDHPGPRAGRASSRTSRAGMKRAPMSVRVSPYLVVAHRLGAPLRGPAAHQFFPLASRLLPDHPKLGLDSLAEQADAPVPGLTHRYADKALFLPLDTCPVYCRFCTRSYAIGLDTDEVEKVHLRPNEERWKRAYAVHRVAARARGHRHQRRRRLPAARAAHRGDRRGAARPSRTCGACASRPRARR